MFIAGNGVHMVVLCMLISKGMFRGGLWVGVVAVGFGFWLSGGG